MTGKGTDAYLKTQILTAPPEKLQLMLYNGAIRFATLARAKMAEQEYEDSYELLVRAQNIVLELVCGLRPEHNPSLCNKMAALYSFIYSRLVEANISHDTTAVDDAIEILTVQRDIWLELLERLALERGQADRVEAAVNAQA